MTPIPRRIATDSKGNIYVTDMMDYSVKKFSNKGKLIKKAGRKGQGPGEFSYLGSCAVSDSDEFWLFDYSKYKFILFDQEGEFLKEAELKVHGDLYGYSLVYYLDEGTNIQMAAPADFEEANPVYQLIIQVFAATAQMLQAYGNQVFEK